MIRPTAKCGAVGLNTIIDKDVMTSVDGGTAKCEAVDLTKFIDIDKMKTGSLINIMMSVSVHLLDAHYYYACISR